MLTVNNLTFAYRRSGRPVIDGLTLTVPEGGIYGLLGSNGAGKSTLLSLMAGALTPASGSVEFDGVSTRRRLPSTMQQIFIVPEEIELPAVSLSAYVRANAPFWPRFSQAEFEQHLTTFGLPTRLNLGRLSMGQRKKVFMSFALACNTPLLLMDEPTNGLDIPGKEAFRRFIAGAMTESRTIIISTHQVRDIDRLLDHVIIMGDSGIALDSSMARIMERLSFHTVTTPAEATGALLSRPSVGGTAVITPNTDGSDTDPDLEMLFELATTRPDIIRSIFNN